MFETLFKRDETVRRYLTAPLVRSRRGYLTHRAKQGAKHSTLSTIAATQLALVRRLDLGGAVPIRLSQVEDAARQWASGRPASRDEACRRFVARASAWLRFAGRLELPPQPLPPHSARVEAFTAYLRRERGLAEPTILGRRGRVDEFLRWCHSENRALADITCEDVERFLTGKAQRDRCSRPTIRQYAGCLRAFFRYAEERGWCGAGLVAAVVAPRAYADEGVPTGPSWEDVQRLLATSERDQPADLRDRAVLLLLAVYGLRAGEASRLRLEDIDWLGETLRVRRCKTQRSDLYPLAPRVAVAILQYLRKARPHNAERAIFLTLKAPVRPLGPAALSQIVSRRMRRLGIDSRHRGAHSLRHAYAQRLLDSGFSLQEIANCLGHRSSASTAIYAKVNLASLRRVADFDLEGLA